jgi:hypothetical protein
MARCSWNHTKRKEFRHDIFYVEVAEAGYYKFELKRRVLTEKANFLPAS